MSKIIPHFGAALRHYRDTYSDRLPQDDANAAGPKVRVTALSLINCMQKKGYSVSSGSYSEIESGASFPRDPETFLTAFCACLRVEVGGDDWEALRRQLAYDVAAKRLGEGSEALLRPFLKPPSFPFEK